MVWLPKKISENELGEYLPEDDAQPYIQSETIQAENEPEAIEKCKETAAEYGGTEPKVEELDNGNNLWDCKFKLWG